MWLILLKLDDERLKLLKHTKKENLSYETWMKRDWDERAKIDAMYFVKTNLGQTKKDFWDCKKYRDRSILGIKTQRYNQIINKKNLSEMRVLEIGCGIGRILISMSEIFGEVYGVDVSKKMIEIAKKYIKEIPNCKVFENNGSDLSRFPKNYFDFCFSAIVFQHIPSKEIVVNYIKEVARVLKPECVFRFQVKGIPKTKPKLTNTWHGIHFTSQEIHKIAKENKFEILEETGEQGQYYWLTFKFVK